MDKSIFAPLDLKGEHITDVIVNADPGAPGRIGSPWGASSVDYIVDGEFDGPKLKGKVLPGGGDWPSFSNDEANSLQVNVRAVWQTHDGAKLFVQYTGFIVFPREPVTGLPALAELDPGQYYFRVAPIIRTDDERYLWINKVLCVGVGRFTARGVAYRIYQLT
jgi:hypothetical protein